MTVDHDSVSKATEAEGSVRREQRGAVLVLTLNRPERRNALSLEDRLELLAQVRAADADESVRALVLTGAGPTFCAGGDISGMTADPVVSRRRLDALGEFVTALAESRLPVVTAVEGGAFGAGLALLGLADLVVAADDAAFAASFVKIGLTADSGISFLLARRIGWARTKRLLLTGETVGAERAHDIGLVDELVPAGATLERALSIAADLATRAPLSVAASKRLMHGLPADLADALAAETVEQLALMGSEDFAEGRRAFADRRRPTFEGR